MIIGTFTRGLSAMCLALGLAACSNDPGQEGDFALVRAFGAGLQGAVGAGNSAGQAAATPQAVAAVLAQVPTGGVIRIDLPEQGESAIALAQGRNGAYRTFGTLTGQTVTFRGPVVTATRGFGFDLMSSDTDGAESRIAGRGAGNVSRVYRYLDYSDDEQPLPVRCSIASEGGETITLVSGQRFATTRMRETCQTGPFTYNNFYWVTGSGVAMRSHQWISRELGELRIEVLRN